MKRYFKCFKCGAVTYTTDGSVPDFACPATMSVRISGICGGYFIEIKKKEYNNIIKSWERNKK